MVVGCGYAAWTEVGIVAGSLSSSEVQPSLVCASGACTEAPATDMLVACAHQATWLPCGCVDAYCRVDSTQQDVQTLSDLLRPDTCECIHTGESARHVKGTVSVRNELYFV